MIETFYDTTVNCIRRTTNSPTASDAVTTIGSYLGVFRATSEEDREFLENNLGQGYCFITDENNDIKVSDQLVDGDDTYNVKGVVSYEDLEDGEDSYLKAVCTK